MAEFVTNKITVPLSAITGYGARAKKIAETILAICDDFTVHSTVSDTADAYIVDLSWQNTVDWLVRIESSGSTLYVYLMTQNADGSYKSETSGYSYVLSENNAFVEVNKYGQDFLLVGVHSGGNIANFMCLKVVDQFTGIEKLAAGVGSSYGGYYTPGYIYIAEGPNVVRLLEDKNANGLAKNDIAVAVPVVHYTESSDTPLSGFVAGGALLYYFYRGTSIMNFDARFTTLSLGGHEFITLTQNLCARLN